MTLKFDMNGTGEGSSDSERDTGKGKKKVSSLCTNEVLDNLMLQTIPDVIVRMDLQGKIRFANHYTIEVSGYLWEEMAGRSILMFVTPEDRERFVQYLSVLKDSRPDPLEYQMLTKEGRKIPFETHGNVLTDENGQSLGLVVVCRNIVNRKHLETTLLKSEPCLPNINGILLNINDRKQTELELQAWMHRYELIVSASGQVAYEYILSTGQINWGCSIENVLGYSPEEISGGIVQWTELLHPKDREATLNELDKAEKACAYWDAHYRMRHKKGNYVWIRDRGFFLPDKEGRAYCQLGMLEDINDRKLAETERDKLISELQEAMSEVKTLSGLLPICSSCKKIRNDEGYWEGIEKFISERSEAEFSHGICPNCRKKLFPENQAEKLAKPEKQIVVLLVDDEEDFRMLFIRQVKRIFKDHELTFFEARNGEEALDLLKSGVKPSLIVLDYVMPRVNGTELLRIIDCEYSDLYDVPRIMISGYCGEQVKQDVAELRCSFLEKTLHGRAFFQQISREMADKLGLSLQQMPASN